MKRTIARPRLIRRRRPGRASRESGQTLVLAALWLTALVGFTAVAIDVGRFFSERRFLQNAADAAALAAATALTQGRSTVEAEIAARDVLARNFATDPTGGAPAAPPLLPVYAPGHAGDPAHLMDGVLIQNGEVRVAVRKAVGYTFGRIVGMGDQEVGARSRAGHAGGLMPIAVREFLHAPGPEAGALAPCAADENRFLASFATQDTACLGTDQDGTLRTDPSAGSPFDASNPANDPSHHGPIVAILGQGATPSNASDFRGFVALDIRNFSTDTSQTFYNGVSGGSPDALKQKQAAWIRRGGYPGPGFTPITTPPHPDDQVAILSGNSAGLAVAELRTRYAAGDEILVGVYPGHVMAIPDFALSRPGTMSVPATGTVVDAGSFRVSRNQAFSGTVDLSTVPDSLDPAHPMVLGTLTGPDPITYAPDPVSPSLGGGTRVDMRNVTTAGATPGIYAMWVRGEAGSPYLTAKLEPFSLNVGAVTRDFAISADATGKVAANAGDTVSFALQLRNEPNRNVDFGGPVGISVDSPLPSGAGTVSLSSTSVTPTRAGATTTLTVNTGSLAPGHHRFIVRATGMNGDSPSRKVTHLLPLTINVAPTSNPGNDEYVDLTGFAVMRVVSADANTVSAYAITPVIKDLNDPRLRRGQTARLAPW